MIYDMKQCKSSSTQTRGNRSTVLVAIALVMVLLLPTHASAQVCNLKQTAQTVSIRNFVDPDNNLPLAVTDASNAKDIVTNLIWNRCVYGQRWKAETKQCIGSPILLTWEEALREAQDYSLTSGTTGWRLPNIKELNSIIDLQCINPPYDIGTFPDTFASENHGLWTSSPHVDNPAINGLLPRTNAWYIDLGAGILNYRDVDDDKTKNFARFVR